MVQQREESESEAPWTLKQEPVPGSWAFSRVRPLAGRRRPLIPAHARREQPACSDSVLHLSQRAETVSGQS